MIFANTTLFSVLFSIIVLLIVSFLLYFLFKKKIIVYKTQILVIFLCFIFLLISIFEPKGGLENKMDISSGNNIVFVLDISKSMNALDHSIQKKQISRLDFAKSFISSFISKNIENNYGLNIFSGEALEVLPLTSDLSLFNTILSGITSNNIAKNGTDIYGAIESSIDFFEGDNDGGLIILISDGHDEDDIGNFKNLNKKLLEKNLNLIVLGVGTTAGSYIPTGRDIFGEVSYKTYSGKKVVTKLNDKALKNLAGDFSGKYFLLKDDGYIKDINKYIIGNIEKQNITKNILNRENLEKYFIFISFILFLLYLLFPFFNKNNFKIGKK